MRFTVTATSRIEILHVRGDMVEVKIYLPNGKAPHTKWLKVDDTYTNVIKITGEIPDDHEFHFDRVPGVSWRFEA